MMLNRGPQLVQFVRAYLHLRELAGSRISDRHSGQIARSAAISAVAAVAGAEQRISNCWP